MENLAAALGRIPSGLFVLTLRNGDDRTGILVSWAMQASFDPPMITVALERDGRAAAMLAAGADCTLNILAAASKSLLVHFARGGDGEEDVFEGVKLSPSTGAPILSEAHAYIQGHAYGSLDVGDHRLFAIQIKDGGVLRPAEPAVHVRRSGLNY